MITPSLIKDTSDKITKELWINQSKVLNQNPT